MKNGVNIELKAVSNSFSGAPDTFSNVRFSLGTGGRPAAPVAEGGPVGFTAGGNRRDWFPGVRGLRAASSAEGNHTNGNANPETGKRIAYLKAKVFTYFPNFIE